MWRGGGIHSTECFYPSRRQWWGKGRGFTGVCLSVCLSVCLFIRTMSQKPLQLGSPNVKLGTEMFHREFWKPIYYGVKRSKVKVTRYTKIVPTWVFALLWVAASCSCSGVVPTLAAVKINVPLIFGSRSPWRTVVSLDSLLPWPQFPRCPPY